ncbi:MAG: DUF58 domain-containing protein [Thermoflexaceae bacterium]|nr:DUF58 domain-containing protein [Thermoflexaceae bacterium]
MNKSFARYFAIIGYFSLILFNGFMFYFLGNYFNLIFLCALIIIPFISFFSTVLLVPFVSADITGASVVEKRHDEFLFHVTLKNSSFLFTNNSVLHVTIKNPLFEESETHTVNLPITPFHPVSVTYPVSSAHCGIVTITLSELYIYDMLNIFTFQKKLDLTREIPVFPDFSIVDNDFSMDFSEGINNLDESQSKGNDTSEVSDVREYIPGDKLQNIHWKLSAKKDILMVKERLSLTSSQLLFYIELAYTKENLLDTILDYAYGIGFFLCNHNIPFTYMWYSARKKECRFCTILNSSTLKDTIYEILYEIPLENYMEIRDSIKTLSGHENYITIGVDYVLEKEAAKEK